VTGRAWRVWGWPAAFAVLSAFGLVAALVDDGVWDLAGWIALAIPAAVCAWGCGRALRR